jgi:hypothetical protein
MWCSFGEHSRKVDSMKQHMTASSLFILTVSGIIGSLTGCSPEQTFAGPPASTVVPQGGTSAAESSATGTGGLSYPASGGTSASNSSAPSQGGNNATGGANSVGGVTATGGNNATGGNSSAATGGRTGATGGKTGATGGKTGATGGTKAATGGDTSGANPTGGNAATGGASPVTTTAANASCTLAGAIAVTSATTGLVTDGTCSGYAYTYATKSTFDTTGTATITPCTGTACATVGTFADTDKLCATAGSVGGSSDYKDVAGIGFNLNQSGATIGTMAITGTGLQISFTAGTKPGVLRAQIANSAGTNYCFDISASTSPVKIPWASFNTECWTSPDTNAKAFDGTSPIQSVQLIVPDPGTGKTAYTFANLCLTGVATY